MAGISTGASIAIAVEARNSRVARLGLVTRAVKPHTARRDL